MKILPKLIAIMALFPCGATMAMLLQIGFYQNTIGPKYIWIHILGMGAAILTALVQTVPRFKPKRLKFLQFHCLLAAAVSHIIAGNMFQKLDIFTGFVFASIAHGITLIATPSYLIFRCDAKSRTSSISFGIAVYLIGVAAMVTLLFQPFESLVKALQIFDMFLTSGIILLIAIVILEIAQLMTKKFQYKHPLDALVEQNDQLEMLFASKEVVVRNHSPHVVVDSSESSQWVKSILLIFPRIIGAGLFSIILLAAVGELIYYTFSTYYGIEILLWTVVSGAVISSIFTMGVSSKWVFLTATSFSLLLGIIVIFMTSFEFYDVAAYAGIILYFFMGVLYPVTHSMVMETANFRFSEILLAVGYLLEMIVLAVMQHDSRIYYTEFLPDYIAIAMCVWAILCLIIVSVSMPKTWKKSIIAIRHEMWRVLFCNGAPLQAVDSQLPQAPPMHQYQHPQQPPQGYWVQPQPGQQPWVGYSYQGHPAPTHPQQNMQMQPPYNYNQGPPQNWAVAQGHPPHPADGYGWGNSPADASNATGATGNGSNVNRGMTATAMKLQF